jgi:hypothetical protein
LNSPIQFESFHAVALTLHFVWYSHFDTIVVFLPPSALVKLANLHIEYPMLFELSHGDEDDSPSITHAGVLEFIAEEGRCYMPQWVRTFMRIV